MRVGCPKEIKNREYRVGLTPESAKELVKHGHEVWIESGAGLGIGASDGEYKAAGAVIRDDAVALFAECEMIVKVKEPQPSELAMLREGQTFIRTFTSRPTRSRPPASLLPALPRSLTRRLLDRAARCRCSSR